MNHDKKTVVKEGSILQTTKWEISNIQMGNIKQINIKKRKNEHITFLMT